MSERKEAWFRILVAIVSGIILYFWGISVCVVTILHWIIVIFSEKRMKRLAEFCEPWNTESYKFYRYLTFVSDKKPFPFSDIERMSKVGGK